MEPVSGIDAGHEMILGVGDGEMHIECAVCRHEISAKDIVLALGCCGKSSCRTSNLH